MLAPLAINPMCTSEVIMQPKEEQYSLPLKIEAHIRFSTSNSAGLDEFVVLLWYVRFTERMPSAALLQ